MNEITELNGEWELHPVSEFSNLWLSVEAPAEGWTRQEIPAHWQEEPVFRNYSGKMIYRKSFPFTPESDKIYRLQVGGVFYRYRVYLNNFALGGARGYFFPSVYNITRYLRAENHLVLEVDSPVPKENPEVLIGIFAGFPGLPENYNPGGIWRPVRILASGPAYIEEWNLRTESLLRDHCELSLRAKIFSSEDTEADLAVNLTPHNFQGSPLSFRFILRLKKGINDVAERFKADNIRPWWTWDLGDPSLYRAELALGKDEEVWDENSDLIGVRTFEMKDLIPHLNGEKLLAKGSNYLPADIYPARVKKDRYEKDMALVIASNQNMVRCYNHIAPPDFYRATDEAGILVWQDFPFRPGYPCQELAEAQYQTSEMVHTLGNHPSVVVWSIYNISGFERGLPVKSTPGERMAAAKLGQRFKELDPSRPVVPVSGVRRPFSAGDTGFGCGVIPGEGRLYRFDLYRRGVRKKQIRFVSWFGGLSAALSEEEALKTSGDLSPEIAPLLPADWKGKTPEELAPLSQRRQSDIIRFYIDRLRYHKYRPTGGMLLFCLRDLFPGIFWSVVDCAGKPKESFKTLTLCYRPVYVFALFGKESYRTGEILRFPICFSSDRRRSKLSPVGVKARLSDPHQQLVWKDQWHVDLSSDMMTKVLGEVSVMLMKAGVYTLEIVWEDGEQVENVYRIKVK